MPRIWTERSVRDVTPLPGSPRVGVSHAALMFEEFRGQGFGKEECDLNLRQMAGMGFDYALCTVESENRSQIAIMNGCGWSRLDQFKSSSTGHTVYLYGKKLFRPKRKEEPALYDPAGDELR